MKATFTGKLLISETTNKVNKIARALDASVADLNTYHHSQTEINANEQAHSLDMDLTQAAVVYLKATKLSDGTPIEVIFELDGYSGSVVTGEIKTSEILILNTDVVALSVSNDHNFAVLVEFVAAGA